jgi:hypothetical protein
MPTSTDGLYRRSSVVSDEREKDRTRPRRHGPSPRASGSRGGTSASGTPERPSSVPV